MQIDTRHVERDIRRERAQIREAQREPAIGFEYRAPARVSRGFAWLIALRKMLRVERNLLGCRQRDDVVLTGERDRDAGLQCHSLICEKLARLFTKLIDAGLVTIAPGTFELPDFDALRVSKTFDTLMPALRT